MRGRGLKQYLLLELLNGLRGVDLNIKDMIEPIKHPVAPHAGAWIETSYLFGECFVYPVAPHAGAWIETINSLTLIRYTVVDRDASFTCTTGYLYTGAIFTAVCISDVVAPPISSGI